MFRAEMENVTSKMEMYGKFSKREPMERDKIEFL